MWDRIKRSHWTKIVGGGLLLSLGAALLADGLDDFILMDAHPPVRDYDEGLVLIGVFVASLGALIFWKGARSYLDE